LVWLFSEPLPFCMHFGTILSVSGKESMLWFWWGLCVDHRDGVSEDGQLSSFQSSARVSTGF
jgi:hypothetical protein